MISSKNNISAIRPPVVTVPLVKTAPLAALHHGGQRERGAVLALALMTLVILTIIGVTAMKGSVLEVRMAGNIQDSTAAFQLGENGLNEALNGSGNLLLGGIWSDNFNYSITTGSGQADVKTEFISYGKPRRADETPEIQSAIDSTMANFEITSEGKTSSGTTAILHQGVNQRLSTAE